MALSVIIVLLILGFIFMLLEMLVIPGTTIAGVIGLILVSVGIWQGYATHSTSTGHILLTSTLVATGVLLYFSLKANTWKKAMLDKNIDGKLNVVDLEKVKPGDTGTAVSRLAPMGKAYINGEYYEVASFNEFINEQTEIEVFKIENNKIIVKIKK